MGAYSLRYTLSVSAGPSQQGRKLGLEGERRKGPLWLQPGVLAAKVYLLVSLPLPRCYINIMNCSQVHQMRFRWSLGALLPKQAKLRRADASDKLQSLSRSTKLELRKVGDHIWPWWPLQQWDSVTCLTLTCQEVLSAFIFVGMGQMGWVSQGNCLRSPNNNENKNNNDGCGGLGLTIWLCFVFSWTWRLQNKGTNEGWQHSVLCFLRCVPCMGCIPYRKEHLLLTDTVCSKNGTLWPLHLLRGSVFLTLTKVP